MENKKTPILKKQYNTHKIDYSKITDTLNIIFENICKNECFIQVAYQQKRFSIYSYIQKITGIHYNQIALIKNRSDKLAYSLSTLHKINNSLLKYNKKYESDLLLQAIIQTLSPQIQPEQQGDHNVQYQN